MSNPSILYIHQLKKSQLCDACFCRKVHQVQSTSFLHTRENREQLKMPINVLARLKINQIQGLKRWPDDPLFLFLSFLYVQSMLNGTLPILTSILWNNSLGIDNISYDLRHGNVSTKGRVKNEYIKNQKKTKTKEKEKEKKNIMVSRQHHPWSVSSVSRYGNRESCSRVSVLRWIAGENSEQT